MYVCNLAFSSFYLFWVSRPPLPMRRTIAASTSPASAYMRIHVFQPMTLSSNSTNHLNLSITLISHLIRGRDVPTIFRAIPTRAQCRPIPYTFRPTEGYSKTNTGKSPRIGVLRFPTSSRYSSTQPVSCTLL